MQTERHRRNTLSSCCRMPGHMANAKGNTRLLQLRKGHPTTMGPRPSTAVFQALWFGKQSKLVVIEAQFTAVGRAIATLYTCNACTRHSKKKKLGEYPDRDTACVMYFHLMFNPANKFNSIHYNTLRRMIERFPLTSIIVYENSRIVRYLTQLSGAW